ncbi:MAG: hypothetical protein APR54_07070 [Candidatus Cloacimonas sp. SDB]|nr:MAG: hypothetical protein APR54_07070 [Candidatus Cloacimonas sp. SDB]
MKNLVSLILAAVLGSSGCSVKKEDKLIIGIIKPSLNHLPLEMAIDLNYLDKDCIVIKYFNSGWETNEALVSQNIDAAIMPFTYIWTDVSQGKEVKIISFLERESDGIITAPEIKSIADLDQKRIGLLRSSTLDLFWEIFAEDQKLEFIPCYFRTPMDMVAALKTNNVDALSFYIPSIFKIGTDYNIIHWYGNDYPSHPCCDLTANTNSLKNKPEQIKILLKALEKSSKAIGDNDETRQLIKKYFGLEDQLITSSLQHIKFKTGFDENGKLIEHKVFQKMLEKGYVKNHISAEEVYYEIDKD